MTRGAQDRLAPSDSCSTLMKQFVFTHYFSELRVLFQQKMNLLVLHPQVEKDILSLFLASSQFNVLRASTRVRPPPGPTWPGCTRAEAAQDGSEDVTVRSVSVRMRCLTDGLSSDNAVDFMHAFATASRELRLA